MKRKKNKTRGAAAAPDDDDRGTTASPGETETDANDEEPMGRSATDAAADERNAAAPTRGDHDALRAELENARAALDTASAELEEARGDKLRLLAEFKNFRQRMERERLQVREDTACGFFRGLLPIVHDLERAREAASADAGVESIAEGIDLVLRRLRDFLAKEGVTELDPAGERFDESTMEAMGMMPSETAPEGAVAHVFQKGLVLGDRLIEPARVLVSSGPQEGPTTGAAE